jgi:hypothetical protein
MFNFDSSATPSITDSVVAGGCPPTGFPTCTNIITINPELGTLADNGGPTKTIALGTGSSAIDAGGANTTCASTDQRGAARPYSSGCDIGAYEYREPTQNCSLATGANIVIENITFNFTALGTLTCVTVEEMGPGVDHPLATGPGSNGVGIKTGNWWHITGNGSDFNVDLTLPYSGADADSRVCRWPGDLGGYGWDCGALDGTGTTFDAGVSVTRVGQTAFSDWAVGDHVGPTAVTLTTFAVDDAIWLPVGLIVLSAAGLLLVRKRRAFDSEAG